MQIVLRRFKKYRSGFTKKHAILSEKIIFFLPDPSYWRTPLFAPIKPFGSASCVPRMPACEWLHYFRLQRWEMESGEWRGQMLEGESSQDNERTISRDETDARCTGIRRRIVNARCDVMSTRYGWVGGAFRMAWTSCATAVSANSNCS